MANRRMFSLDIVDSDAFLDMPTSTQALYFHLAMRADDDGFVSNPKKVMKICGAAEDDYKILIGKRFIIPFEKGICVIKHWKIHNYLRKDTYKETRYIEEKSQIIEKENGSYTERGRLVDGSATQVREGKVREGKVRPIREEKSSRREISTKTDLDVLRVILSDFKAINPNFERMMGHTGQLQALDRLVVKYGEEKITNCIAFLEASNKHKYAPTITTPIQLESKMGDLVAWAVKQKSDQKPKFI